VSETPPRQSPATRDVPRRSRTRRACALTVLLALAVPVAVGPLAGCGGSVLPQVHDEGSRLDLARRLYAKGDYGLAVEALAPFSTSGSGAANVDEAVYLLGLCHLKQKDFAAAQGDFERLLKDYPESDSAPSSSFRQGEALWGLGGLWIIKVSAAQTGGSFSLIEALATGLP